MCGRYASSRKPEDLVEEFEIDKVEVKETLAPDYNVAPTKQVYAVVAAPAGRGGQARRPSERQLRTLQLGPGAVLGQGPLDRQQDDQRPHGDRAREAGLPAAVRVAALPAARPTATTSGTPPSRRPRPASRVKQPFFIHPADGGVLAMAGLYEIWRDPTRDEDDPQRFRWTCTVLTTTAEDAVGHIHDRMPLLVEPRAVRRLARPVRLRRRRPHELLVPAAPGRLEAYPVSTQVNNVRNNGPELLDAARRAGGRAA